MAQELSGGTLETKQYFSHTTFGDHHADHSYHTWHPYIYTTVLIRNPDLGCPGLDAWMINQPATHRLSLRYPVRMERVLIRPHRLPVPILKSEPIRLSAPRETRATLFLQVDTR